IALDYDEKNKEKMDITKRISRFANVTLGVDLSRSNFNQGEIKALHKFVQAGSIVNRIYLRQKWKNNEFLLAQLSENSNQYSQEIQLFNVMKGPWDKTDNNTAFIPGGFPKPKGANFYPEDMTKSEFNDWVSKLSDDEQKAAKGFYHVIRRNENGQLFLRPYSEEYKEFLVPLSKLLKETADLVDDVSLGKFLWLRGDAFLSNQYFESEIAWLNISKDCRLEVTVGPYEVYDDELFSYKSSFELFVHARDFESSALVQGFAAQLQDIEDSLPVPDEYKNKDLKPPTIIVVNELYSAGIGAPVAAAYNLPNNEQVKKIGSKLVLIKNVQRAKYESLIESSRNFIISEDQRQHLSFDAYFARHSNGPHYIVGSNFVPVRDRLQEYHSAIEEAKADLVSIFAAAYLMNKGLITQPLLEQLYVTYLAKTAKSLVFGHKEAHALGRVIQLNYILSQGGFIFDDYENKFRVDFDSIQLSIANLTKEILMMQGDGDKGRVKEFIDQYGTIGDNVKNILKGIKESDLKVEIWPIYNITWPFEHNNNGKYGNFVR
ncbi:17070_t:CDS:2, partial [Dentiscutata erythropus]